MKRIVLIFLCAALVISFAGCGKNENADTELPSTVVENAETALPDDEANSVMAFNDEFLGAIKALDFEMAKKLVTNPEYFDNFDSMPENSFELFKNTASKAEFEFKEFVRDKHGNIIARGSIVAPSLVDAYGRVTIALAESATQGNTPANQQEMNDFMQKAVIEYVNADDIQMYPSSVEIQIVRDGEGYKAVMTDDIVNAFYGDISGASAQMSEAFAEGAEILSGE